MLMAYMVSFLMVMLISLGLAMVGREDLATIAIVSGYVGVTAVVVVLTIVGR